MKRHIGAAAVAAAAVAAALLALAVIEGDEEETAVTASPLAKATTEAAPPAAGAGRTVAAPRASPPYALAPTRRCLHSAGFAVSSISSADPRLRALGDLAQRTSLELGRDGRTLGLALGDARLLESLLRVPDDPYRLEVRRNALLMFRSGDQDQAALVRGCLRPR